MVGVPIRCGEGLMGGYGMSISQHHQVLEYINNVCSQIKNRQVHQEIQLELLGHIEEAATEHLASGAAQDEAVKKAIAQMGAPELVGRELNKIHKTLPDWSILIITILMTAFGLLVMYFIDTKGVIPDNHQIFNRSLLANLLGVCVIVGLYFFDYRKIQPYSKYIYAATSLILVFVVYNGTDVLGARMWLTVGPISFNFVEMSLFLFIIAIAGLLDNWSWHEPKKVLVGLALGIVPAVFMFHAPSLSTGVAYLCAFAVLMLVSGVKLRYFSLMVGSCIGLILFKIYTEPYLLRRLLIFINPYQDPTGAGWINIQLNKITHSAGLFGHGFNLSPTAIPQKHTDFIFTYIVYAFGWVAGIILTALIIALLIRLIHIARVTKTSYGKLIVSGFVTIFAIRFFWNILMNLSLAPICALGLPFLSYGGSQYIFSMSAVGLITNIYKLRNARQISIGGKKIY